LLLLLPWSAVALMTILAYRTALPGRGKAIPFWTLLQVERAGSALNAILPLGNHGSQVIKLSVLRHWFSTAGIVGAAVWCTLGTGLNNLYAGVGPAIVWAAGFGNPLAAQLLLLSCVITAIPSIAIISFVRHGLTARVSRVLGALPLGFIQRRKERALAWAQKLDTHLASAIGDRRGDFARLLALRVTAQTVRVLEIWLVITLLNIEGGLMTALLYNAMSRAVTQLLGFIPGRIGALEAISLLTFEGIGLDGADGLALALTLRFGFLVNLLVSHGALARMPALAQQFPPRAHPDTPPAS
ncbi:MAG: hypothetical protein ACPHRO_14660, partial [Nannocystaceae bacterium]